jgi:predicted neuraminidase
MSDGTLALACNPVSGNWAARTPLSVLLSPDNGESWSERFDLESEPGEFSYPAIIEVEDGLMISYTWNRRRIATARLPLAKQSRLTRREE